MQVAIMLIFLAVWLFVFWLGSIALETTGLERAKARFQSLSALTGTGFTTREAESIVNHPKRRRIATWLIFIGNAGIIAFIILMILYLRAGLEAPSLPHILIIIGSILLFVLLVRLRILDRFTNVVMRIVRRGQTELYFLTEELLYQVGDYGVARVVIRKEDGAAINTLKEIGLGERGISVLALERGGKVMSLPNMEENVLAGDYLLCYGKVAEMIDLT